MQSDKLLKSAVLEVVKNQLRSGDPPQTRQTYDRLIASGLADEEVRRLIGCVVLNEIVQVLASGKPYDAARFVASLERLPEMPADWERPLSG